MVKVAEKKNKGGRPKKQINWNQVNKLCGIQCTGEEIASIVNVSYETLQNKIKEEFGVGFLEYYREKSAGGKASLRRRQFKLAEDGNPTMLIWLGKQYLGQKDKQATELSGPECGPIEVQRLNKLDLSDFTNEELELIEKMGMQLIGEGK